MKTLIILVAALCGLAATKKLQSPKAAGETPRVFLSPAAGIPMPPKSMPKANTNQYPGWVGLSWTYSTSPEAAAYTIYQGTNSRAYNVAHDVGLGTNVTQWPFCLCPSNAPQTTGCAKIFNLQVGQKYFFTVTARSTNGLESDYSNEVDYTYWIKTNRVLTVHALAGPSWSTYTNLPPMTNTTGATFFRTVADGSTVSIQSGKTPVGPWTDRLFFPHTNTTWKLSITRTNWR